MECGQGVGQAAWICWKVAKAKGAQIHSDELTQLRSEVTRTVIALGSHDGVLSTGLRRAYPDNVANSLALLAVGVKSASTVKPWRGFNNT